MLICLDCQAAISNSEDVVCDACSWRAHEVNGIRSFLSSNDQRDSIIQSYIDNYGEIASDDLSQAILDERYISHQVAKMVGYIKDVSGAKICDVGCGKGFLSRALVAAGADSVTTVDITTQYLKSLVDEGKITPIQANAENLPFREEFDIITSTDVLEHVLNVGSFLISVHEALKPNGMVYIRVPYNESLLNYSPRRGCKYRFVHLRSFNKKLLGDMMRDAGFTVHGFRLDGFSIYTPRQYIMRSARLKAKYIEWQTIMLKKLAHPSDVTSWNNWLARILMRPQELVVVAQRKS